MKRANIMSVLVILALFLLPIASAININVELNDLEEVMIPGLSTPSTFNLEITNNGPSNDFRFFNLLGFLMDPDQTVRIKSGETKNVPLMIHPYDQFEFRGFYSFTYFIRVNDNSEIKQKVILKVIDLEDAFEVGSGDVNLEENTLDIYIRNKEDFVFEDLNVDFSSPFFELSQNLNLGPKERANFTIQLNNDDFQELVAGFYTLNAKVSVGDLSGELDGVIKFSEKNNLVLTEDKYGFITRTQLIKQENLGNTMEKAEITTSKNIISRLFTNFEPEPVNVERKGLKVNYLWNNELKPGEELSVKISTNWFYPILIIGLFVIIIGLVKKYSGKDLVLRKRVGFVKTKGGEFALKMTIYVHAQNYVERVSIIDRLPPLLKIHPRFGREQPLRVDEKNRRIEWGFEKLESGETRILSYVIYSKVGVLGKFALPQATSIYEREGKVKESKSNRTFFVSEQKKDDQVE